MLEPFIRTPLFTATIFYSLQRRSLRFSLFLLYRKCFPGVITSYTTIRTATEVEAITVACLPPPALPNKQPWQELFNSLEKLKSQAEQVNMKVKEGVS